LEGWWPFEGDILCEEEACDLLVNPFWSHEGLEYVCGFFPTHDDHDKRLRGVSTRIGLDREPRAKRRQWDDDPIFGNSCNQSTLTPHAKCCHIHLSKPSGGLGLCLARPHLIPSEISTLEAAWSYKKSSFLCLEYDFFSLEEEDSVDEFSFFSHDEKYTVFS